MQILSKLISAFELFELEILDRVANTSFEGIIKLAILGLLENFKKFGFRLHGFRFWRRISKQHFNELRFVYNHSFNPQHRYISLRQIQTVYFEISRPQIHLNFLSYLFDDIKSMSVQLQSKYIPIIFIHPNVQS